MPLAAGTRLGPYEILAPIGAGGMGEVYKARDSRLDRIVAIKVSRENFSQRSENEARAVAALNHPHICTLYDVGPNYLVMEFVEGAPLKGPLPLAPALAYAAQICRALAAAHAKNITHRDLKPANILVTKTGIKLLDFGLAKQSAPLQDSDLTQALTQPGAIVGTLNYMSPEQLQSKEADARSDIFAFGLVLFEMLTGKRAFDGSSAATVIAAIIERPAPSLTGIAPPALDRLLQRCLFKDPDDRWQSASDLAFALEQLASPDSGTATAPTPSRRSTPWLAAALALLALAGLAAAFLFRPAHPTAPTFYQLTANRGLIRHARFSPDGQTVVFGAAWNGDPTKLWLERADANTFSPLAAPDAELLAVSPTGELAVALHYNGDIEDPDGTLAVTGFTGGTPREMLAQVLDAAWSHDGSSLAVARRSGDRVRLEYPIGKVLLETQGYFSDLRFSHRGDRIAFLDHPRPGDNRGYVSVIDSAGHKKVLTPEYDGEAGLAWSPDDREIWFSANDSTSGARMVLHAVSPSGNLRIVFRAPASIVLQDIAADGRVLLTANTDRAGIAVGNVAGGAEKDLTSTDFSWSQLLSNDGQWIAFCAQEKNYAAYARRTDGTPAIRLGDGEPQAFSPDGAWLATALPPNDQSLSLQPLGVGQPRTLALGNVHLLRSSVLWMPDGKGLLLSGTESGHLPRSYFMSIEGGQPKPVTAEGVTAHLLSPDGRRILTVRDGKYSVQPLQGGEPRPLPAIAPEDLPVQWLSDGRTIILQRLGVPLADAYRLDVETGARQPWKQFVPREKAGLVSIYAFHVAPDASRYLLADLHSLDNLYIAQGLK